MILNQDQQKAADDLFQFLMTPGKKFFRLSGPGGTGKTTLMRHVMDTMLPLYEKTCDLMAQTPIPWQIILTATTNKAVEVLRDSTGLPAETIHSFMNLTVKDNYSTGKSEIKRTNSWLVHRNKFILIDECSMVDSTLLKLINEGTDDTCKVVFIGDHCQLPPVFEPISPVYADTTADFAELRQPMRNAGQPALMQLCKQVRYTVETGEFFPMEEVSGVVDYLDDARAQAYIDQTFLQEGSDNRIIAYTNQRVQDYNNYIRGLRGYTDLFQAGENLINNSAFSVGSIMLRPDQPIYVISTDHSPEIATFEQDISIPYYKLEISQYKGHTTGFQVDVPFNPGYVKEVEKFFAKQKDWYNYFAVKNRFPDLRQTDASTVHKAQGSTFDTVLIDLTNIGSCNQPNQVARLLYVAVSRARSRVLFYGALPQKYVGQSPFAA